MFQLKQIELDKNLSYKEKDIYLKAKLAKEMSCDSANVLFATEEVKSPFDSESQTVHSVIATNTTQISPVLSMLERRKLRCLRFESIGLTLSWFALNHCLPRRNKTWGIIESLTDTTVIYLFSGSGWICQKALDISVQVADFASKLEQRIKQILVLSGIQLEVTLFSTTSVVESFTHSLEGSGIRLVAIDSKLMSVQSKSNISRFEIYALVLAYKTQALN